MRSPPNDFYPAIPKRPKKKFPNKLENRANVGLNIIAVFTMQSLKRPKPNIGWFQILFITAFKSH